jgi:hypothetical protein
MLLNTAVGTPVWMAPEVLRGKGYGSKADIFSFALVLSHLLTGREPFHDVPPLLVGDRVVGGLRPTLPRSVIAPLRALVTRCWSTNEAERLPAADIVRQLDEIRRAQRDQPPPMLQLPPVVQSALFQRCSFLMLCQLAQTCLSLRNSVRAFRINSLVPLDSLGLSLEAPYDATLRSYAWYHGNLSKQEATAMLRSMPAGVFLVRASSLPNHFVLCGQLEKQLLQILVTPVKAPSVGYTIDIEGRQARLSVDGQAAQNVSARAQARHSAACLGAAHHRADVCARRRVQARARRHEAVGGRAGGDGGRRRRLGRESLAAAAESRH